MRALVTGGAGLVGSSLCARLIQHGAEVFCVDNLSLGTERHLEEVRSNRAFTFENWDVSKPDWAKPLTGQRFDVVFHLAANSDISLGHARPEMDCERTFQTTFETLRATRALGIPKFVFASTSAVYGKNPPLPSPEDCPSLYPVSIYGAGKLASESFISAFVENYKIDAWVFRFGNVVGTRLTHGVIFDFIQRLRKDPSRLDVLGNGQQTKTYIDVEDCVGGMLHGIEKSPARSDHASRFQVFNLSTDGATSVREIAQETSRLVTQGHAAIHFGTSAVGWVGDVPRTGLDVTRMKSLGWRAKLDSTAAVFQSIRTYYEWSQLP